MPWDNPWFTPVVISCGIPIVGLFAMLWFLKTLYSVFFGGVRSVVESAASVPRQAIQTAGQVHIVNAIVNGQLEARRLENPENYEKVVAIRVWGTYAIGALLLFITTIILYLAGVIGGVVLTVVDFGYLAYGFHLMNKARQGKNPKRIAQRDARRLVSGQGMKEKNGG